MQRRNQYFPIGRKSYKHKFKNSGLQAVGRQICALSLFARATLQWAGLETLFMAPSAAQTNIYIPNSCSWTTIKAIQLPIEPSNKYKTRTVLLQFHLRDRRRINQLAAPNREPPFMAAAILHCRARDLVMRAKLYFCGRPADQDYKSRDRSEQRDNSLGQTNFPGRAEKRAHRLKIWKGERIRRRSTRLAIINGETLSCKSHGAHSRARCRLRSNIFYICCRGCCQFTRARARQQ